MEKRAILAIVLSFIIIFVYYTFFLPKPPPRKAPERPKEERVVPVPAPPFAPQVAVPAPPPGAEREFTVETGLLLVRFSTRGAGPVSWRLKEYYEKPGRKGDLIDLVELGAKDQRYIPLSSYFVGANPSLSWDGPPYYATEAENLALTPSDPKGEVSFIGESASGLKVSKLYRFTADGYGVGLTVSYTNSGTSPWSGRPALTLLRRYSEKAVKELEPGYVGSLNGSIQRKGLKKVEEKPIAADRLAWFGLEDRYFISSIVPETPQSMEILARREGEDILRADLFAPPMTLSPGETRSFNYTLFFGPKSIEILSSFKVGLDRSIDFGWFQVIARPLLQVLNYFSRPVANYGLAIIILTVAIKVVFWPLTHKSMQSMQRMQKLQPIINQLKEKFKNDKVRLNKEVMDLYKAHKANPMGGCLPMVLQIPVLYALYRTLLSAIELRHAPFFWWIKDLAAKDPTYITPILMGASMFWQQKMTPTMGDPMQAKMMLMMPVIFTFMFLNFPSGLVLYWLVNNVLSIAQQYYTFAKMGPAPTPAPAPAAEKKKG